MTPELIKQWVDEAGFYDINGDEWVVPCSETLYRFAALVAAHEREECAKVCDVLAEQWRKGADGAQAAIATSNCAGFIRARSKP